MKPLHPILALAAVLAISFTSLAYGQTAIVLSSTAPTTTSTDIVNFVASPSVGGLDYSNKNTPAGQTFTTLSALGGYDLSALTLEGINSAGQVPGTSYPWTLTIYSVSGTTLTPLQSQSFYFTSPLPAGYASDYLTFDLTTSVALAANTEYAFTIGNSFEGGNQENPSSYYGFADSSNTGSTYSGGTAFNGSQPTGSTSASTGTIQNYDMSFAIDMETAPEPSTWAMMFGGAAMLLGLLRFRRPAL